MPPDPMPKTPAIAEAETDDETLRKEVAFAFSIADMRRRREFWRSESFSSTYPAFTPGVWTSRTVWITRSRTGSFTTVG